MYLSDNCDIDLKSNKKSEKKLKPQWDFVIITASGEGQAESYRKQLDFRIKNGLLPGNVRFEVLPDCDGRQIGSGGATFNALRYIGGILKDGGLFTDKRILVIHSGGEGVRIPQYSVCGKLFSPVSRELFPGTSATLFDEIFKSVAEIPSDMMSGMLSLSGDILISFDPGQVDLRDCEAAAISVLQRAETGVNHGVFVPDVMGNVNEFLHKLPIQALLAHDALDSDGNVHLDTGAIWLNRDVIQALYSLITTDGVIDDIKFNMFASEKTKISFYADIVFPLAAGSTLNQYYSEKPEGEYSDELLKCRSVIWETLRRYRMKLITASPALFIHFGTTAELLKMKTSDLSKYSHLGWSDVVLSTIATPGKFSANSSFVDMHTSVGNGCYIENSFLYNSTIGTNCIISNTIVESANVPDNMAISCQKQNDGDYVVRIYGINDNPKMGYHDAGTFLGFSLKQFMKANKLKISDLWESKPYDLWTAKLFLKTIEPFESLQHALNLFNPLETDFRIRERISFKQSTENADFNEVWHTNNSTDGSQ